MLRTIPSMSLAVEWNRKPKHLTLVTFVEPVIDVQLVEQISIYGLNNPNPRGNNQGHLIETALLCIKNDVHLS